mgnify:FL=1|jgi:hypothetical protein
MGCKLSIGIKGDAASKQNPKITPACITHEQSTSPIQINAKTNITTQTSPKGLEIQKDFDFVRDTEYMSPDAESNGTESKHSDSKNRWKSKAAAVGAIGGGSRIEHIDR